MYKPINEGGANMLNIDSFFIALKAEGFEGWKK